MTVRRFVTSVVAAAALAMPGAAHAASTPGEGPGGPILVVVDPGDPSGHYYAEILHAEGLNEFAVANVGSLSAASLSGYQVVVLASAVSDVQAFALQGFVQNGGDLIAMRPSANLAGLLGLGSDTGNLSEGYVKVDPSTEAGAGITDETMQFHGTADQWTTPATTTVARLFSDANSATSSPAVTLRNFGGGRAAAFTYDLASSVVATRQGNIAWAGQKRDGQIDPIRSDDLFFPDWVDFAKIQIPQADEQQRLLANLVTLMSADRLPLPRFWYLPDGERAAVVMTGDDHAHGGTVDQFEDFKTLSPSGCSVADWDCVRSTSYIWPNTPISNAQVAAYQQAGFEISLHLNPASGPPAPNNCGNFTLTTLRSFWAAQMPAFRAEWPSANPPVSNRNHCIAWSDWDSNPKVELENGVRLDTTYYYWPGSWVQDRPGLFTGSGFPQRFADVNGAPIDVYQAATQITDESGQDIPLHIATLLDNALGPDGYFGVVTANMHTDAASPGALAIVGAALARGVPVVSAAQMLTWLDGRDGSSFGGVSFANGALRFSVAPGAGANGLEAMIPGKGGGGLLTGLSRNGVPVSVQARRVKGVDYAVFDATAGSYVATYSGSGGTGTGGVAGVAGSGGAANVPNKKPAGLDTTPARVKVKDRRLHVSDTGRAVMRIDCLGDEVGCIFDVRLKRSGKQLAKAKDMVAGHQTAKLHLRLSRAQRKRLAKAGTLKAVAVIRITDAGLNRRTLRAHVTLYAPSKKKR